MSRAERVRADYRAVGLSTEGHPVEREGKVVNVQARDASTLSVGAPEAVPRRDFR